MFWGREYKEKDLSGRDTDVGEIRRCRFCLGGVRPVVRCRWGCFRPGEGEKEDYNMFREV